MGGANSDTYAIKTWLGKYLTAMKDGTIKSLQKKVRLWEKILVVKNFDGTISLKTTHNTYLNVDKVGKVTLKAPSKPVANIWKPKWANNPDEACKKWSGNSKWGARKNGKSLA